MPSRRRVLSRVVAIKENACKTEVLRRADSVSERGRSPAALARLEKHRFLHSSAQLLVLDRRRDRGGLAPPARASARAAPAGRASGSWPGSGPGREADARNAEPPGDLGRAVAELERPDRVGRAHVQGPVARDPRRPGVARDRGADRLRPALDDLARGPACGPKRASSARTCSDSLSRSHLHDCAGSTGSALRCVAVITTCPMLATRSASTRRRRESSSESTSSSSSSGAAAAARPRRAAARAARAAARPASRSSAGRGRPTAIRTSSRCGPRPGRAAREVGVEPRLERGRGRRLAVVAERRARKPELAARAPRSPARARRSRPRRAADELRAERGDALRPRRERRAVGEPELHAPQRGVPLRERRGVVLRQAGAGGLEPAEHAVEVRAPRGRARPSRPPAGRA